MIACDLCKNRSGKCPKCRLEALNMSPEEKRRLIEVALDQAFERYSICFIRCKGFMKRFHHANLSSQAN
jgi:hypothetical protein